MKVVIIGAGIIGSACAEALTRSDPTIEVVVIDRSGVGSGTTSRCEGNILLSDKGPGLELDLAVESRLRWLELGDALGRDAFELEEKGGLVVAMSSSGAAALDRFADSQRGAGVRAEVIDRPHGIEPHLSPEVVRAVHYSDDMQVQPVLAAATLLAAAARRGATVKLGVEVTGARLHSSGRIAGVQTTHEDLDADVVINAAGTWAGHIGDLLGAPVPVMPRRGFLLVTEPVPLLVRHKVYSADYVDNVGSSAADLQTSSVIEGTRGGTILIGASRERVGFDTTMNPHVVRRLAEQAVAVFPFLADVNLMRVYRGFRPYCPDHLPVIGPDPRVPGVIHACGHEGAGIGLAPATAALVVDHIVHGETGDLVRRFAALGPERLIEDTTAATDTTDTTDTTDATELREGRDR